MVRIAIVEDEDSYVEILQSFLKRYQEECGQKFYVTVFRDGDEIVEKYKANFDIILMDIKMRCMDGMTAAEHIREVDQEVIIMFITNMIQYAIRGYAVNAMDYILKPVKYFAFSQKLARALNRLEKKEKSFVTISIRGGALKLELSQIYYIESQDHYLVFHTKKGEFTSNGKLSEMEQLLSQHHFFRSNKGYLVNLEYVDGVRDNCAIVNEQMLPISRYRKNEFLQALTSYVSEAVQ